jgi:hypothetical protein
MPGFTNEDFYALLNGVVDGVLVAKAPMVFVAKTVVVLMLDLFGIYRLPASLRYASLEAVGLIIFLYIFGKLGR